jgi:hypothetical protein
MNEDNSYHFQACGLLTALMMEAAGIFETSPTAYTAKHPRRYFHTRRREDLLTALTMEAASIFETTVNFNQPTRQNIPEDIFILAVVRT